MNSIANINEESLNVVTNTRRELTHKYESIVYDYLAIMNSSETVKSMECAKVVIQLGLSAITHIYKIAFCITKNVSTSADHCQKGIYCFIEYVEQTYKLGYINSSSGNGPAFDFIDAVTFIYEKTISDLRSADGLEEHSGSSSAVTNILSVSQSHQAHGTDLSQCKSDLEQFIRVAKTLAWFNHPSINLTEQMDIIDSHLIDFIEYAVNHPCTFGHEFGHSFDNVFDNAFGHSLNNDILLFIETVQDKFPNMDIKDYMNFLFSIKKQIKKQEKKGVLTMNVPQACLNLKAMSGETLKDISESEKWKKPIDDLAKSIFYCHHNDQTLHT
jgi:hypothetical protein